MQLLLILALLLLGNSSPKGSGKNAVSELLEPETIELIKEISGGGEEVESFVRNVGQISELVNAFAPLLQSSTSSQDHGCEAPDSADNKSFENVETCEKTQDVCNILKPVQNLADDGIYNALARAV